MRHAIKWDVVIAANQFESLVLGLGDQQAVERVAVVTRQRSNGQGVRDRYRQRQKTVGVHRCFEIVRGIELAKSPLDGDFPDDGGGDVNGILAVSYCLSGRFR